MFSIITMASSTTKPVEMVSAIRERLSSEKPSRNITAKVPTSESGTATLGMMVAERLRRKRKMTMTTRPTVSISSNSTSLTEDWMLVVMSVRVVTRMEAGRSASSCGRICWMRSTTVMVLAPGWRWMLRMTAGVWFIHAACLVFSTPLTTSATFLSKTGAPLE